MTFSDLTLTATNPLEELDLADAAVPSLAGVTPEFLSKVWASVRR